MRMGNIPIKIQELRKKRNRCSGESHIKPPTCDAALPVDREDCEMEGPLERFLICDDLSIREVGQFRVESKPTDRSMGVPRLALERNEEKCG
jgi:hypothetical protein